MPTRATTFYKVPVYYCFGEAEEKRRRLPLPPLHSFSPFVMIIEAALRSFEDSSASTQT
jgi:hypothetical protein